MHSISKIVVALTAALPIALAGTHKSCPNTSADLSCSGSSSNTCCIDSPGGLFQQVQFWDTDPVTGPDSSWTIHGLWPNNCDGTYSESCDSSRDYTDITTLLTNAGQTSVLDYMQTYWVSDDESNEAFWEHEWGTHGTCISTLDMDCYTSYTKGQEAVDFFVTVVGLFKTLPTYTVSSPCDRRKRSLLNKNHFQWLSNAGITPSSSKTYKLSALTSALESAFGAAPVLLCEDTDVVYEIYYCFNTQGPLNNATFIPAACTGSSTNCPSKVSYPPK